jgi:predicted nucleotidyltransferase
MQTKDEILKVLADKKSELQARFKVRRIALFGSFARGDQSGDSDIDILVDVDPSIGLDFIVLADRIEQLLGRHVDLVSRRAVKPHHFAFIEKDLVYV